MKSFVHNLIRFFCSELTEAQAGWMVQARLRAIKSSAAFIERESNHLTNYFENHWKLREFVVTRIPAEGMLLEFGVNRGRSANYISGLLDQLRDDRNYFGFDTFTGLTEDWGGGGASRYF